MALQKTKEMSTGLSGNYWRVLTMLLQRTTDMAEIGVALYKDATARQAGKEPMAVSYHSVAMSLADLQEADDAVEAAYSALKELPAFDGATDV